jgi:hypothetical protein
MPHMLRTKAGAGPTTELSSQNAVVRSRAGRVRVGRSGIATCCGPGPEPDPKLGRSHDPRVYQRDAC